MPFVPSPRGVQISLNQRLFGERIQNTLYAINFGEITETNLLGLASDMLTWVDTQLYPALSTDIFLAEVSVRWLNTADSIQRTIVPATTVNGNIPNAALPGNVAACVSFRTGFAGRSRRGRNYVAGIPEQDVTGNALSAGIQDTLRSAYENLLAPSGPMQGNGYNWIVLSRIAEGVERTTAQPTLVNSVLVDAFVDSQRRRLAGRGS